MLDMRKLDSFTDYFVICTGEVDQHVRAIADSIEEAIRKQTGDKLLHREGRGMLNWILLDYVDVVAHVFKPASREFYRLDDLWGDADVVDIEGITGPPRPDKKSKTAKPGSAATAPKATVKSVRTKTAATANSTAKGRRPGTGKPKPAVKKSAAVKPARKKKPPVKSSIPASKNTSRKKIAPVKKTARPTHKPKGA